jgi:hypothetical protein
MDWAYRLAEERIQQAMQEGAFDNLDGEGKPLPPDPFFRLPEEIRLAARVMTMCGCAPHELTLLRDLNEARRHLADPGTTEEKAQRMREYSEAELKYNVAMDRHREMYSTKPQRAVHRW